MKMGNKNSGKRLYTVNKDFFKSWSPDMAYILGFTCADGNVHERTLAWDLTDKDPSNFKLLQSFNRAMGSNYPITKRNNSHRIRISNPELLLDIKKLGIIPNKKKVLEFPQIPKEHLSHFIRGFLEGDGWIVTRIRKNGGKEICAGFSNGSPNFSKGLVKSLRTMGLEKFNLRKRIKIMKNGKQTFWYQLEFYSRDAHRMLTYLYKDMKDKDIRLERKYKKYLEAMKFFEEQEKRKKLGRKNLKIQKKFGEETSELIRSLLKENLIPREIAKKLNISLATLYRWMDKMKIRKLTKRGSKEWNNRIIKSKKRIKNG
jgi:hypothetical protein